ncbi:2OG-Fe(II) oxygenase [uncultured Sneathiella sp.]|uniref:2OG-Fe(II) oxygenase n=1 Tax=uncultured Sneathiella sp. TaxID=879315 RepID=UPI0030EE3645|tara:strand:+ start:24542 stop:25237 length:696 start_codon:yes stop_codon:yes gene_type:complete
MKSGSIDWQKADESLDRDGYVMLPGLLQAEQCRTLIKDFEEDARYRRHIVMQHHGYGQGEYKYFDYPLPTLVAELREEYYPPLAKIANRWEDKLGTDQRFPETLGEYTAQCHAAGQKRPTPLILKYGEGDYNRLHQDLYGELLFPLQMAILLSDPTSDFEGGEFVLTEQRPRQQSRARIVPLSKGDAVIFAVNQRPVPGKNRFSRVTMRHGVSDVRKGQRFTLGIIFHDAK